MDGCLAGPGLHLLLEIPEAREKQGRTKNEQG